MTFFNTAIIDADKLILISDGGSRYNIGIRQARKDIAQIETSTRALADSTVARLDVLKRGVALWEART